MPYLGLHLDSYTMMARLSEENVEALLRLTQHMRAVALVLAGSVMSLLAMMSAAHPVIRLGLLCYT